MVKDVFSFVFSVPYIVYAVFLLISLCLLVWSIYRHLKYGVEEIDKDFAKNNPKKEVSFNFMMGWVFATTLFIGLIFGSVNNLLSKTSDWLTFFSTVFVIGSIVFLLMLLAEKVTRNYREKNESPAQIENDED